MRIITEIQLGNTGSYYNTYVQLHNDIQYSILIFSFIESKLNLDIVTCCTMAVMYVHTYVRILM